MDIIELIQGQVTLITLFYTFGFLVGIDVFTGLIKAWKNGRLKSKTLRDGLFASLGEFIILFLCILSATYIPVTSPLVYTIIIYMVTKELYSILENLVEIGVRLPKWLVTGLQAYTDKLDDLDTKGGK